jgi:hypothetical protein
MELPALLSVRNYEDLTKRALEEGENNPSAETDRAFIKAQAYATLALVKTVEEVIRVMPA